MPGVIPDIPMFDNEPECRICQFKDTNDPLFSPCNCTGTSGYIHQRCWDQVLRKCQICHTKNHDTNGDNENNEENNEANNNDENNETFVVPAAMLDGIMKIAVQYLDTNIRIRKAHTINIESMATILRLTQKMLTNPMSLLVYSMLTVWILLQSGLLLYVKTNQVIDTIKS